MVFGTRSLESSFRGAVYQLVPHFRAGQRALRTFFSQLENVLRSDTARVFVHCKNGRDRSGITVYMILRRIYQFDEDSARSLLHYRVDVHGAPLLPSVATLVQAEEWLSRMHVQ